MLYLSGMEREVVDGQHDHGASHQHAEARVHALVDVEDVGPPIRQRPAQSPEVVEGRGRALPPAHDVHPHAGLLSLTERQRPLDGRAAELHRVVPADEEDLGSGVDEPSRLLQGVLENQSQPSTTLSPPLSASGGVGSGDLIVDTLILPAMPWPRTVGGNEHAAVVG